MNLRMNLNMVINIKLQFVTFAPCKVNKGS